jgi:hypothetical protein
LPVRPGAWGSSSKVKPEGGGAPAEEGWMLDSKGKRMKKAEDAAKLNAGLTEAVAS